MRGVGDEITPHGLQALQPGDVADQQQVLITAIRNQTGGERSRVTLRVRQC